MRSGVGAQLIAGAVLATMAFLSRLSLGEESQVHKAELHELEGEPVAWTMPTTGSIQSVMNPSLPPRAALSLASMAARSANLARSPDERMVQLRTARHFVNLAVAARPHWGNACVVDTYVTFSESGLDDPRTLDAIKRSYDCARFLEQAGDWRMQAGIGAWPRLDNNVRQHLLDESAWMAGRSAADYERVMRILAPQKSAVAWVRNALHERHATPPAS